VCTAFAGAHPVATALSLLALQPAPVLIEIAQRLWGL